MRGAPTGAARGEGTRFYRESIDKVREAVARLRAERLSFLCELGDLKDMAAGESDSRTGAHLAAIEAEIRRFGGPTCHVLGNHDMDNLSKAQFLDGITNTGLAPPCQSPRERTRPVWHHARACFDECGVSLGLPIARCAVGKFRYEWREKLAACGTTLAISALSVTSVVALHVRTTPLRHA